MNPWNVAGLVLVAAALFVIHQAGKSAREPVFLRMTEERRRYLLAAAQAQDAEMGFV